MRMSIICKSVYYLVLGILIRFGFLITDLSSAKRWPIYSSSAQCIDVYILSIDHVHHILRCTRKIICYSKMLAQLQLGFRSVHCADGDPIVGSSAFFYCRDLLLVSLLQSKPTFPSCEDFKAILHKRSPLQDRAKDETHPCNKHHHQKTAYVSEKHSNPG